MKNNFDVIKNYGYEDEEIMYNSDDYNSCVTKCNELQSNAGKYEFYGVYPSDSMLGITEDLEKYTIFDCENLVGLNYDLVRSEGFDAIRHKNTIYKLEYKGLGEVLGYYI